jgi:hypothetical protein
MTVQDIILAFGGSSAAVAAYFLRECHVMLKKNTADIAQGNLDHYELKARVERLEERLKTHRA